MICQCDVLTDTVNDLSVWRTDSDTVNDLSVWRTDSDTVNDLSVWSTDYDTVNDLSVWRQTHYNINDKNNTVNFWYLSLHNCHYSIYTDDKTASIRLHLFCLTLSTVCFKLMRIDCKHDLRLQVSYQLKGYDNTY